MGGDVGEPIKYIVVNNSAEARKHLSDISKHIGLQKDGKTNQYAPLMRIYEDESPDNGKYIIPIVVEGTFKCDDLYDASILIEYQEHWGKSAKTKRLDDGDDSDSTSEGD